MLYREIGNTGISISVLSIGTMRFKGLDNAIETIHRELDLGLNYLDCGAAYSFKDFNTNAEAWVGEAIKGRDRSKMVISAKAQPRKGGEPRVEAHLGIATRDQMWQCIENSLKRIGVSFLDFYQFWDMSNLEHFEGACVGKDAPLVALREAKDQGVIKHLGITTHAEAKDIMEILKRVPDFKFITVYYNLMRRQVEEAVAYAYEHGVGVACMGPLYGGILTGESPTISGRTTGLSGLSVQEIAFRFLYANPAVTTCIGGMNDLSHVAENVRIASEPSLMTAEELKKFSQNLKAFSEAESLCTGCQYCQKVCPKELPIWQLMGIYQLSRVLQLPSGQAQLEQIHKAGKPNPAECALCGQCEEACPQHLPIGERMKCLKDMLASLPAPEEKKG